MNEQDELLIARYLDGRATAEEVGRLNARLATDAEFRQALLGAGRLDVALREILQVGEQQPALPAQSETSQRQPTGSRVLPAAGRFRRPWVLLAAAAAVLLVAGLWLWQRPAPLVAIAQVDAGIAGNLHVTRNGSRLTLAANAGVYEGDRLETDGEFSASATAESAPAAIHFPDGTRVAFAAGTRAEIRTSGGKRVDVSAGAVFGDVAHQPAGQPMHFVSLFGQATVVGTKLAFVVDAGSARLEVTEGKVELQRAADGDKTMVVAGQFAVATAKTDTALVAQTLPGPVADFPPTAEEHFDTLAVDSQPALAAGPEKDVWRVVEANGNRFAQCTTTALTELELGHRYYSNYTVECRFQADDANASVGIYSPVYIQTPNTWGVEVQGNQVYILAGETNPTLIGTPGRPAALQLPAAQPGQWRRIKIRVDAHELSIWVDDQLVLADEKNFMFPGVYRFFAKNGTVRFDDLVVAHIPH